MLHHKLVQSRYSDDDQCGSATPRWSFQNDSSLVLREAVKEMAILKEEKRGSLGTLRPSHASFFLSVFTRTHRGTPRRRGPFRLGSACGCFPAAQSSIYSTACSSQNAIPPSTRGRREGGGLQELRNRRFLPLSASSAEEMRLQRNFFLPAHSLSIPSPQRCAFPSLGLRCHAILLHNCGDRGGRVSHATNPLPFVGL
jgi:hypothetical protein